MASELKFSFGRTERADETETGRAAETPGAAEGRSETDTGTESPAPGGTESPAPEEKHTPKILGRPIEISVPSIPKPQTEKKTRKPRESKPSSSKELKDLESNIAVATSGIYALTAKMLGADYFALSPEEASNIAAPMAKIIDRMAISATVNKYGDALALSMAVGVATIPRVMMYMDEKKQKQGVKNVNPTNKTAARPTGIPAASGSDYSQNPLSVSDYGAASPLAE